jgi:hypothetical protein
MLPRSPRPPLQPTAPKKHSARYVVEIRDAAGGSLLTIGDWTDSERDLAILAVLRLVGIKAAAPATRKASKARIGEASADAPQKN